MTPETKATSASSADESRTGFIGRVTGVWFSPGETFKEIAKRPDVLFPIIALLIIGGITGYLMIDRIGLANFFGQGFRQAVNSGSMTQEQMDQQLAAMTTGNTARFIKLSFILFGALGNVIFAVISAAIFRLVSMVMGYENGFKKLFSVSLYTFLAVGIISSILFIVILFLKSPEEIDIQNLGRLESGSTADHAFRERRSSEVCHAIWLAGLTSSRCGWSRFWRSAMPRYRTN